MSDTARRIGMAVLRALAQVVGGLLAIFGGGCVIGATFSGMLSEGFSAIQFVVLFGVLPLVAGIRLFLWGQGERRRLMDFIVRRRGPPPSPPGGPPPSEGGR
ncbi:MAG: hypothetical protein HY337_09785 [Gemmatimonadetes bacterium]|nr:hypothetical protein [Gemmatimonadota bacterium]